MKRYQIFISSTYEDLIYERRKVIEVILKLRHIPIGMEHFVATNEEQFNFIKKLLDDTDYYILIVGNRYGSTDGKGISYTEKEYDYAVKNKIPVLAFLHKDPESLPVKTPEKDSNAQEKLERFRDKVKKNRTVSLFSWETPDALANEILIALTNIFNDTPRHGWERIQSHESAELLNQLNDIRLENDKLKSQIKELNTIIDDIKSLELYPWDDSVSLIGKSSFVGFEDKNIKFDISQRALFVAIGPLVLSKQNIDTLRFELSHIFFDNEEPYFTIPNSDFHNLLISFIALGVIEINNDTVCITKLGQHFLFENNLKIDDLTNKTKRCSKTIKEEVLNDEWYFKKYIHELSDFNSNPEAINYIGTTLMQVSVYLDKQNLLSREETRHAKKLIEEILKDAMEDERIDMGAFDPIFDLTKIYKVIEILEKGLNGKTYDI